MPIPASGGPLVRDLPHFRTRYEDDHEMLPRHAYLFRRLLDKGRPVSPDSHDALVVYDHQLPKVFRILLDFWSALRPIKIVRHPLLEFRHLAKLHGVLSGDPYGGDPMVPDGSRCP